MPQLSPESQTMRKPNTQLMNSFSESGLDPRILDAIQEMGFHTPTPIQMEVIPQLLQSDRDLIALAQTGTGKTAAFGLPMVQRNLDRSPKVTSTLILCPTRELCVQITRDLSRFASKASSVGIVAVYGGASMETQVRALSKGAQIVVGTPGRVRDLIKRKRLKVDQVAEVVLDEADEMLTMGFKEELDDILSNTPTEKQTLLFSATISKEVLRISTSYMDNPERISVATLNQTADQVEHLSYIVQASDRYELLKRLADLHPDIYGIVFCRTRRDCRDIAARLIQDGYNADALHGDLSQAQRDEVMARFRSGHLQLLVATDVAARGLDVKNLTHVINYHLPDDPEVYVHRSGRTGRAGKSGVSIAIIHTREGRRLKDIERKGGFSFTSMQAPTGEEVCRAQVLALVDKIVNTQVDHKQIEPFLKDIFKTLKGLERDEIIMKFVSAEFNRFLDYYRNAKDINPRSKKDQQNDLRQRAGEARFQRLFINLGEREGMDPKKLITLINQGLRSGSVPIGKIEIKKKFTFFDIDQSAAETLRDALSGHHYNGKIMKVETSSSDRPTPEGGSSFRGDRKGGRRPKRGGGSFQGKKKKPPFRKKK